MVARSFGVFKEVVQFVYHLIASQICPSGDNMQFIIDFVVIALMPIGLIFKGENKADRPSRKYWLPDRPQAFGGNIR